MPNSCSTNRVFIFFLLFASVGAGAGAGVSHVSCHINRALDTMSSSRLFLFCVSQLAFFVFEGFIRWQSRREGVLVWGSF